LSKNYCVELELSVFLN